jgi:TolA-binding protein
MPPAARAATDADLAEIREQIRQLKENYEARINALEQRLKEAEARPASAPPAQPADAATPPVASAPQPSTASTSGISAFNPAISAVLQGHLRQPVAGSNHYAPSGFVPAATSHPENVD